MVNISKGGPMKRKTRTLIGVILILSAIGMMIYWEMEGRDQVRTEPLLVAARDIAPGEVAEGDMFRQRRAGEEEKVSGALKPVDIKKVLGNRILHPIPENSQIVLSDFGDDPYLIKEGQGIFLIRSDWIFSVSSSLRKGDRIRIYTMEERTPLGEFQVAFVKDAQGKEITASEDHRRGESGDILDRTHGTAPVDHLEILAEIGEYRQILEYLFGEAEQDGAIDGYSGFQGGKLILQQKEERNGA